MGAQRFSIGKQFRWNGMLYEVKRLLPGNEVNIENVATSALRVVRLGDLVGALFDDDLYFIVQGKQRKSKGKHGKFSRSEAQEGHLVRTVDLKDYPPELVAIAERRLEIIQPLLALGMRCTKADVRARVAEVKASQANGNGQGLTISVSVRSIYRWMSDYRESGNDIRSLIPETHKRGGVGVPRTDPEVEAVIKAVINENYYKEEKVTIPDLVVLVAAAVDDENKLRPKGEHLPVPCEATISRRVDALDMYERFAARHGRRAANQEFRQYEREDYPERPLERVEIDNTPIDLIVVDDEDFLPLGRPNLTKALDTATRYPLGWYMGFEPPSYYSAMECLYHTICPKPDVRELYGTEHLLQGYGMPYRLRVDNGKEFIGDDLEDACLPLGIILEYSPVRTPQFKAAVERHLRTCNGLFHALPGTTFSNIFEKGDYDSAGMACITLSELEQMLHIFLVDVYAEKFHKGLGGVPARRWETAMEEGFSPRLPPSAGELRVLLGRVVKQGRVVHHYGIDFLHLRYNCPDLAPLRKRLNGEKAKVKYHPGDLSTIYVRDPFNGVYIEVPCIDDMRGYVGGMSLWKHRVVCAYIRRHQDKIDLAALGRAKRKIQEIVDNAMGRRRRRGGKKLARWNKGGQPPSLVGKTRGTTKPVSTASQVEGAKAPAALPMPDDDDAILGIEPFEEDDDADGWSLTYDDDTSADGKPVAVQEVSADD